MPARLFVLRIERTSARADAAPAAEFCSEGLGYALGERRVRLGALLGGERVGFDRKIEQRAVGTRTPFADTNDVDRAQWPAEAAERTSAGGDALCRAATRPGCGSRTGASALLTAPNSIGTDIADEAYTAGGDVARAASRPAANLMNPGGAGIRQIGRAGAAFGASSGGPVPSRATTYRQAGIALIRLIPSKAAFL